MKQKEVVAQTPEWTFKVNVARNVTFQGHEGQIFTQFGSKMAKKKIFKNFTLVSLKVTKLIIICIS